MPEAIPAVKTNLTLIGMPGAGKSTVGVILAKKLGMGFVDTDVLIQVHQHKTLQQIMEEGGHLHLRAMEEREILALDVRNHVIATGGSVVYSEKAMARLREVSRVIFLEVGFEELQRRIHNFSTRGIARARDQSFGDLFAERQPLYRKYAEITIDGSFLDQEELAAQIIRLL
ncbi:MAG TPA: shikimate kinase [Desulfobacteraceae bacterium]|nr:shikimate kinase [Desulfobacteraceae bacterium]